jgi:tRNA threonylcarbamoyladenosine biosynthesis protein TsaE
MQPITIKTETEMVDAGRKFGEKAQPGDVLALVGDLGAGKTHFAKGVTAGAGCAAEVTSPTFSLIQEYTGGRLPVFHFDFYRLDHPDELISIGWDDYLEDSGLCIVEWADKFPDLIPKAAHWLYFTQTPNGQRTISKILNPKS